MRVTRAQLTRLCSVSARQETDADGSGELDLTEFKKLAQKMIGVAKEVKNDIRKKKELQQLNRKRKAAGLPPLARLPQQAVPKGRGSASAREKGKSSSPTEAEQELKKKLAQKLQSDEDPTVRAMKEARIRAERKCRQQWIHRVDLRCAAVELGLFSCRAQLLLFCSGGETVQ